MKTNILKEVSAMGLFKREINKREAQKLIKQAKFCIHAVSGLEELKFWLIPKDGYVLVVEESGNSYWLDEWSEDFVASLFTLDYWFLRDEFIIDGRLVRVRGVEPILKNWKKRELKEVERWWEERWRYSQRTFYDEKVFWEGIEKGYCYV